VLSRIFITFLIFGYIEIEISYGKPRDGRVIFQVSFFGFVQTNHVVLLKDLARNTIKGELASLDPPSFMTSVRGASRCGLGTFDWSWDANRWVGTITCRVEHVPHLVPCTAREKS
jgi:hypothetical protein